MLERTEEKIRLAFLITGIAFFIAGTVICLMVGSAFAEIASSVGSIPDFSNMPDFSDMPDFPDFPDMPDFP